MPPRAAAISPATLVTSRRAGLYRMGPQMCISARSGGLPASIAATNFCSRSPNVAQSSSTSTFRSFAHASMCLASTSLAPVTKLLKSQTRSFGLAWALAIERSTSRPAAVPPVTMAARRRNSRRAITPPSSFSARLRRRASVMVASRVGWSGGVCKASLGGGPEGGQALTVRRAPGAVRTGACGSGGGSSSGASGGRSPGGTGSTPCRCPSRPPRGGGDRGSRTGWRRRSPRRART